MDLVVGALCLTLIIFVLLLWNETRETSSWRTAWIEQCRTVNSQRERIEILEKQNNLMRGQLDRINDITCEEETP